ncbi:MAG: hypothetical protein KIT80_06815 [Chitinophagaceae bacterium]|nr:hypothetical protein [Chitinophagaceae bacterium]MCW5926609.1 hypothetical protein [Chitinophagaceae bacterium]
MNETVAIPVEKKIPVPVRFFARLISFIFHPLFIGVYIAAYLVFVHPDYFIGVSKQGKAQTLLIFIVNAVFFPLLSVLLCKALGFIQSLFVQSQKERIILYSITMVFFFWTFYVFKNKDGVPSILTQLSLGLFLSVIAAFIANIYFKVSMHATAAGGMLGIFVVILFTSAEVVNLPLVIAVLLAGLICSARLIISDHSVKEITWGFFLGFLCQWIAYLFS